MPQVSQHAHFTLAFRLKIITGQPLKIIQYKLILYSTRLGITDESRDDHCRSPMVQLALTQTTGSQRIHHYHCLRNDRIALTLSLRDSPRTVGLFSAIPLPISDCSTAFTGTVFASVMPDGTRVAAVSSAALIEADIGLVGEVTASR